LKIKDFQRFENKVFKTFLKSLMAKKKVCKKCKLFVDGSECPICKGNKFTQNWQGRLFILDPNKSHIAKK